MNKLSLVAIALLSIPGTTYSQTTTQGQGGAFSCPAGDDSIACKQKEQVQDIWVDMNKSVTYLTDELVQNPDSVIEAGCLDDIMQLDLSVITIDPYNIWSSVYSGMKDKLMDMACSAVQDKVNEAMAYLDAKLEAPMGLGSVSLQQRGDIDSFSDIQDSRIYMSNDEAKNDVVEKVFGEYPRVRQRRWTEQEIEQRRIEAGGKSTRAQRSETEEKVKAVLDVDRIFGRDDNGEGNE